MPFPVTRMLRYRQSQPFRNLVAETSLSKSDFIYPIFINETLTEKRPVKKMPGIFQHSPSSLLPEVERIAKLGLESVIVFGIPGYKDEMATSSHVSDGVIQKSIAAIKKEFPQMIVIADCCLCEYTSHGHCGIMEEGRLDNDKTLQILQKVAISYAENGADIIAPSGMMDGMVQAIRRALDSHQFSMTSIMSYAIKFSSQFYGPFREAAGSGDCFKGDRKHHFLAPSQKREVLREALMDIEEGADFLIVKPGLPYLDIIHMVREKTLLPVAAYQVSGEYSTLKAAAQQGLLNELEAFEETLIGLKRAGSDLIISYYADEIAKHLK